LSKQKEAVMKNLVQPVRCGESTDLEINELLKQASEGWWRDSAMFGVLARQPDLLKNIVPVFVSFFMAGRISPQLFELMRLKTGEINRCGYCMTVRTAGLREDVAPKECLVLGQIDEKSLSRREYLAVRLAEFMAGDPNLIPDEFYRELKGEFSDEEIVELVFACAIFNFGNKFNITMRLDTNEESEYPKGMAYPFKAA
jgi:alkylhydroperoxidase family enzyme